MKNRSSDKAGDRKAWNRNKTEERKEGERGTAVGWMDG